MGSSPSRHPTPSSIPLLAQDLNAPDCAFEDDDLLGSNFDEQFIGVVPAKDAGDRLALCRPDGDILSHKFGDELVGSFLFF